jgi:tripartite ATP-independent transporter DctP family solute receptor
MAVSANAPLSRFTPRVLLFDLPFLFRDDAHWQKVVDGNLGQEIAGQFTQYGFRSLGYFDGGWRSPYNSKRPIQKLDDVSGMKFRTMESPMHISIYQALGAKGVPMASSEQYTALQQGVVDGSDAPITWYRQLKHYEIAKHMSTLPLFKLTVHLLVSEKSFAALPADVQKVMVEAGAKASAYQRERERQITATLLEELQRSGVKVSQLQPGELEKFVAAMQKTVWKEYEDKIGKDRIATAVNTR